MTDPLDVKRPTTPFRGALLTVGMRWTDRLLGVLSTFVLARLLVPADFGLVAMAMVVVGLVDVLLDLGVPAALVQNTASDRHDFDTAWTLRILQMTAAALIVLAASPWVARYYGDPRVSGILEVAALSLFIAGLENIGTASFIKNMEFGRDFRFLFMKRLIGVFATIVIAVAWRSYWALVVGSLVTRISGVVLSYFVSSFRPRLSLSRFGGIWSYSQWNMFAGVGDYLSRTVDRFLLGRNVDASLVGAYTLGEEVATLPTTELLAPLGRVMFPTFAAARGRPQELARLFALALGVQALIGIPAAAGIMLVAGDAIPLMLGKQWTAAVPVAQVIAMASLATSLGHSAHYLLLSQGRVRSVGVYQWAKLALFLVVAWAVGPNGVVAVAGARLVASVGGLVVVQWMAQSVVVTKSFGQLIGNIWRPLIGSLLMAGVVTAMTYGMASWLPLPRLLACCAAGVLSYAFAVATLWRIAGSPVGAETYVLEKLRVQGLLERLTVRPSSRK